MITAENTEDMQPMMEVTSTSSIAMYYIIYYICDTKNNQTKNNIFSYSSILGYNI